MRTKETEPFILDELKIHQCDGYRNRIDTAYATDVPVLVEFEYEWGGTGEDDEEPHVYQMAIKSGDGVVLQAERCTLTLWHNCDISSYLTAEQETRIEEEMYRRMSERAKEANDQSRIDAAEQQRQERAFVWGQQ